MSNRIRVFVVLLIFVLPPLVALLLFDPRPFDDVMHFERLFSGIAKIPKPQIVISIGWLNHVSLRIELKAHLSQIVAEKPANRSAE
ncbi:hypothetical protein D9M72_428970 [compost metagenome]